MVLSSYVIDELHRVIERKFPSKLEVVEKLLECMSYELVYTPKIIDDSLISIRDIKDYPVIYTAITEDIDILITGDKDFENLEIERPEIMTVAEFISKYK